MFSDDDIENILPNRPQIDSMAGANPNSEEKEQERLINNATSNARNRVTDMQIFQSSYNQNNNNNSNNNCNMNNSNHNNNNDNSNNNGNDNNNNSNNNNINGNNNDNNNATMVLILPIRTIESNNSLHSHNDRCNHSKNSRSHHHHNQYNSNSNSHNQIQNKGANSNSKNDGSITVGQRNMNNEIDVNYIKSLSSHVRYDHLKEMMLLKLQIVCPSHYKEFTDYMMQFSENNVILALKDMEFFTNLVNVINEQYHKWSQINDTKKENHNFWRQ